MAARRRKLEFKIVPSILNANFSNLQKEESKVRNADMLQFDVMDGHFVNNITMGPSIISDLKTNLPKDVHLMIESPEKYIGQFAEAGAAIIDFHIEAAKNPKMLINQIKQARCKVGIAISPQTSEKKILPFLDKIDQVIVMTVNPGWGGQKFIDACLKKVRNIRKVWDGDIQVDGGINAETIVLSAKAGANVFVAGSYVFKAKNPGKQVEKLRKILKGKAL